MRLIMIGALLTNESHRTHDEERGMDMYVMLTICGTVIGKR